MNENPIITYRRNGGSPQVWERLEIYGDGSLVYRSRRSEPLRSQIPTDRVMKLLDVFRRNDFFSMPGFYSREYVQGDWTGKYEGNPMEHKLVCNYQDERNTVTVTTDEPPEIGPPKILRPERFWNITKEIEGIKKEFLG